jgi:hypothetical protein
MLLDEAGLLVARDLPNTSNWLNWRPTRLTLAGHEFLDASREPSRWQKAKKVVLEKTGSLSFEALKQVLFQLIKEALK